MHPRPDEPTADTSPTPASPVEIDTLTRRMPTERLEQGGIKSIRILSESRFREVLEGIVEERVRRRLAEAAPEAPTAALREEYRARWDRFRARYEEKLRRLEEALMACGTAGSPPPRPR